MRRARGTESDWSALLGEAARSLGVAPVAPPLPDLSDPARYLDFFGQALDSGVFPYKSRHPLAIGPEIKSKSKACEWICEQICVGASHPQWIHRSKVDQLGILFADVFQKIGDCRLPICVGAKVASQLFACWSSIADLRLDPALREGSEIASRSVHRTRTRLTVEKNR